MDTCGDFGRLTPELLLDAVEAATGLRLAGFTHPLPSYINRVYELQAADGTRLIAKFYRPGRWTRAALDDEHRFVAECAAEEIPVVPPATLAHGGTLGEADGIFFAVYPKRRGRDFEPLSEVDWTRLGHLLGRMHAVGARCPASARVLLHPARSTAGDVRQLLDGGIVAARWRPRFRTAAARLLDTIVPLFEGVPAIRIHGDCHRGNILDRPGEGLMLIDFDDMAMGPPVQDLWMLLPEVAAKSEAELGMLLRAYRDFHDFDPRTLRLIEPLRAMRMLYFLAWISRQVGDPNFPRNFPDWAKDSYWGTQTTDLEKQLSVVQGLAV